MVTGAYDADSLNNSALGILLSIHASRRAVHDAMDVALADQLVVRRSGNLAEHEGHLSAVGYEDAIARLSGPGLDASVRLVGPPGTCQAEGGGGNASSEGPSCLPVLHHTRLHFGRSLPIPVCVLGQIQAQDLGSGLRRPQRREQACRLRRVISFYRSLVLVGDSGEERC